MTKKNIYKKNISKRVKGKKSIKLIRKRQIISRVYQYKHSIRRLKGGSVLEHATTVNDTFFELFDITFITDLVKDLRLNNSLMTAREEVMHNVSHNWFFKTRGNDNKRIIEMYNIKNFILIKRYDSTKHNDAIKLSYLPIAEAETIISKSSTNTLELQLRNSMSNTEKDKHIYTFKTDALLETFKRGFTKVVVNPILLRMIDTHYQALSIKKNNYDDNLKNRYRIYTSKIIDKYYTSNTLPKFDISPLTINSYDCESGKMKVSGEFTKGNIYRYAKPDFENIDNKMKLVNILELTLKPTIRDHPEYKDIKSLRYGTPIKTSSDDNDLYRNQCNLITEYIKDKRVVIISLLDVVKVPLGFILNNIKPLRDKTKEYDIIETEIEQYSAIENVVFMNMSINNNVNSGDISTKSCLSTDTDNYCENIFHFLIRLNKWCTDCNKESINNLLRFWDNFVSNVTTNTIPINMKSYCDSILTHTIDNANVQMSNEVCRLIMFCYISLIMYLLSIHDVTHEYMLLYHCKSGQDRTGTFYAINQMVNEVTNERYADIIIDIENNTITFVDIYDKYFSPKPKSETVSIERINNLYTIIYKHLLFSYYITLTSTGFPGIKWSLGKSTENQFSYLLLRNAEDARAFEGASILRGA